ncbi:LOW QUALITY PROTEIN: ficolin-2-like [Ciconia maguari]
MYLAEKSCQELLAREVVLSGWYTIYPWDCADHAMAVLCEMDMDRGSRLVSDGRGQGSQLVSATGAKVRGCPGPCGHESSCPCTSQQKKGIQNILLDIAGQLFDCESLWVFKLEWDSVVKHKNMPFSTKDCDKNVYSNNCTVTHKGAWWYHKCHNSNLNGFYHHGAHSFADGINWQTDKGCK